MKQTKQFLRPLLMAIVMMVGMLVPQGAWAEYLWVEDETRTISSDASCDEIEVHSGGVLIINEGVTLTVTSSLYIHDDNSNGFGTVINYGTIIGDGHLGLLGGVLANHGHIELGGSSGNGTFTFYNTGTLGGPINLSHIGCDHDEYDNLGTVEATCTHGAGTQYRCKTCYYMRLDETSGALPHDFHNHNGIANICSSCGHTTYDEPAYGDGSEEDPYQIANAANLYWFADYTRNVYNHANAILTADIVLNDGTFATDGTFTATGADEPSKPFPWIRIGGEDDSYYGTFDGNGHTISGMYVNDSFGLFYDLYGSVVNLGIVNCYIRDDSGTGAICYWNDGTISNCYTTGILSGSYGYGICNINTVGSTISNCYSTCSFVFDGGGICGTNSGTISNCYTSDNTAIQHNNKTASEVYSGVSAERFASGEIAWLLNGSVDGEGHWTAGATDGTQKWYQKLGENGDSYPVLAAAEGNTVYYGYENCLSESETYSNDLRYAEKEDSHDWADEDHTYCNECYHSFIRYTTTGEEIFSNLEENEGLVANVFDSETSSGYLEFDHQLHFISEDAFYNQPLSTVILSWGTNTIGRKAFQDCASLTSITGAWINSIHASAFLGCTSLASVSMPNLNNIGDNAFQSCEGLESVDFPSVSTIDDYAFYECTGLSTVSLPKAERIDPSAFHGCTNLTKLSVRCSVNRYEGFEDVPEDKIIRLHQGDKITIPEQPATCIEAGYEAYSYCAWCEDYVDPVEIPALGHSFTSKTLTATADEHGLYAYVCNREECGEHGDYNVVKAGEGESATTIALTATTVGETTTYTAADVTIEDGKAFSTPVAFTVPSDQVTVARTFTASKPATVMLPFSIEASLVQGATFSEFSGVSYDAEKAQWVATMTQVETTLQAYKPYIVMLDEGNVSGKVTFDNKSVDVATFAVTPAASTMQTADENGWTFQAVNAAKTWGENDPEVGKAYGFAGKDKTVDGNEIHRGDFVRIAAGASAKPGRCYLLKEGSLTRATEELPATIKVRFIVGSATGIGTLDTETGEMTLEGWYDLNGNKIEQPSKGGVYINNNKKVMVK